MSGRIYLADFTHAPGFPGNDSVSCVPHARRSSTLDFDVIVIGGGTVGASIAYGLAKAGQRVAILDGSDTDARAARTNFGLVWVQGKGDGFPAYQRLTRASADLWPEFAAELEAISGIGLEYTRPGGLSFCISDTEYDEEDALGRRMAAQPCAKPYAYEMLDHAAVQRMLPGIRLGAQVRGASYSPLDGHVNPLKLLAALLLAVQKLGGVYRPNSRVRDIAVLPQEAGFRLRFDGGELEAGKVVIAAGNGSPELARTLDLPVNVTPQRGQLLITERVAPVFGYAGIGIRQTSSGTFQLGGTYENVGMATDVTRDGARSIAQRAVVVMPDLARLRIVRQWAGLRVLSRDGYPVYDQSARYPGAFCATCHSGVTLAAYHAGPYAARIALGSLDTCHAPFSGRRFGAASATGQS